MTKMIVIQTCADCPMEIGDYSECGHPDAEMFTSPSRGFYTHSTSHRLVPEKCPLRTEPVHIHLKPQVPQ